jgi:hypothetical protein
MLALETQLKWTGAPNQLPEFRIGCGQLAAGALRVVTNCTSSIDHERQCKAESGIQRQALRARFSADPASTR